MEAYLQIYFDTETTTISPAWIYTRCIYARMHDIFIILLMFPKFVTNQLVLSKVTREGKEMLISHFTLLCIILSMAMPSSSIDLCSVENKTQHGTNFDLLEVIRRQFISKRACEKDSDCLPWTYCNGSTCVCREKLKEDNTVKCDDYTLQLSVLKCHCVTFDNKTGKIFEGSCIENCENNHDKTQYLPLPLDVSSLNKFMCEDRWNRTGRLCGKCLPGLLPSAYPVDMRCVECPEGNRNIWKYILTTFGPLTIFYFIVLFFKINATSSHLHGYLLFSQQISAPALARNVIMFEQNNPSMKIPTQGALAMYTLWNLDILRSVYSDMCLDASTLTILALDYAVAIYPLVLIGITYILIVLHNRNFRVVVFLWKPFRCVFILLRRNWDTTTTVIDAYATFFLLSFVKIVCVSFDLLFPVPAHDLSSGNVTWVIFYDGTVDYFGSEHLPYAILAIVFLLMLTILPTLLIVLYPFRWFQRILACCKLQGRILTAVMNSFQGCYKDGTESGTRDCRWFAAVPLIGRFIILTIYATILDGACLPLLGALIVCFILLTALVQPHKHEFSKCTKIDITFWGFLALFVILDDSVNYGSLKPQLLVKSTKVLRVIVATIPMIYMACITIYWILSRMRKVKEFFSRVKAWKRGYDGLGDDFEPDRLVNPEQYQGENLQVSIADNETLNNTRDTY